VQKLKKQLELDQRLLQVTDFGAGSKFPGRKSIAQLAKTSHQPKVSKLLCSIVDYYQPKLIVELGTSLGLSALHMAAAAPDTDILTIEGCPYISKVAKENFQRLGFHNIQLVVGEIGEKLNQAIAGLEKIDLLFVDANHRYEPTLDYFSRCSSKFHSDSLVVIDDIHWSDSMEQAWKKIQSFESVTMTVDLFYAGVVFFKRDFTKQHFVLPLNN
jgi:predicted O-methyltransferase YrrM